MKLKILLLLILPSFYWAQISTDRPGFGTGTSIVNPGNLQLESGLDYQRSNSVYSSAHLLRLGVVKDWEIRLETTQNFSDSDESTYGFSTKYKILDEDESFLPLTIVGTSDFKFDNYSVFLVSDKSLTKNLSLQGNLGYKKSEKDDILFVVSTFGYSLGNKWSVFAEYFGNYAQSFHPDHNIDFGTAYLASKNLQFDLAFGSHLDNVSENHFVNAGISYIFIK